MTPEGWKAARVEDLAAPGPDTFLDGDWIESKDQDESGRIRLLQVGNILRGSLKTAGSLRWVNDETVRRLHCSLLRQGDILIARMPDPIGRACLVPELPYPSITAVDCAILRVDPETVEPEFAVQYFNSDQHLAAVASHITGTTRQRISRGNLAGLPVLLPPLCEQRAIVGILSSVDAAIHATQAVIEQLQVVKKAMMAELLTRGLPGRHTRFKKTEIGEVPEEWEVVALAELADDIPNAIVDGPFGSNLKSEHYRSSGIPVIQSGFVTTGHWVVPNEYVYVDEELFESQRRSAVRPNDIVMAKIGANAGACARVPEAHPVGILAGNSLKITPGVRVDARFLLRSLQYERAVGRLDLLRSTTAQPAISLRSLKQFMLRLPPRREQEGIASVLETTATRLLAEAEEQRGLEAVKAALMSVLLTGEVRVKPDEEAA